MLSYFTGAARRVFGLSGRLDTRDPNVREMLSLVLLASPLSDLPAERKFIRKKATFPRLAALMADDSRFRSAVLWPAMRGEKTHHHFLSDALLARLHALISLYISKDIPALNRGALNRIISAALTAEPLASALRMAIGTALYDALIDGLAVAPAGGDVIAYLDSTAGMTLRGWAVNTAEPDKRPRLAVFVNGTYCGSFSTSLMRSNLMADHGGDGFFGFEYRLRPGPDQMHQQRVSVHLEDADTGALVVSDTMILGHSPGPLQRLDRIATALEGTLDSANTISDKKLEAGLQKQVSQLLRLMPRINRFQFTPFDQYRRQYDLAASRSAQPASDEPLADLHILRVGESIAADFDTQALLDACSGFDDDSLLMILQPDDRLVDQALLSLRHAAYRQPEVDMFIANHMAGNAPVVHGRFDPFICATANPYGRAVAWRTRALRRVSDTLALAGPDSLATLNLAIYGESGMAAIDNLHEPLLETPQAYGGLAANTLPVHISAVNHLLEGTGAAFRVTENRDPFVSGPPALAQIRPAARADATLSVIIPTRNALDLTRDCVESLLATITDPDQVEIIIVNNQSDDPDTLAWMRTVDGTGGVRVIDYDAPFNWSAINNAAARQARGTMLLFLNNDTLAIKPGWDRVTRDLLTIDSIGAVGARLLFEDGTIQHAGVVLYDVGVATHEGVGQICEEGGYLLRTRQEHLCAAVTGAYLACRRDDFEALGGFNETDLSVTFNDVDFCLRLREKGLGVLYSPQITFHHLESKSRGYDFMDPVKRARAEKERHWMETTWSGELGRDPYYPPEMARIGAAFSLMKGYDVFTSTPPKSSLSG